MTEKLDAIYGAAAGGGKFDPLWDAFLRVRGQRDLLLEACGMIMADYERIGVWGFSVGALDATRAAIALAVTGDE